MFRPFTGQNRAGAKSFNGILLGFSELFRKFDATEVYSEVAKKCSEVLILTCMEGQNDSLELFLPGCELRTFPWR